MKILRTYHLLILFDGVGSIMHSSTSSTSPVRPDHSCSGSPILHAPHSISNANPMQSGASRTIRSRDQMLQWSKPEHIIEPTHGGGCWAHARRRNTLELTLSNLTTNSLFFSYLNILNSVHWCILWQGLCIRQEDVDQAQISTVFWLWQSSTWASRHFVTM